MAGSSSSAQNGLPNMEFVPVTYKSVKSETSIDDWDDTILIKAYDESLKLAKREVARRIARSTNTESKLVVDTENKTVQPKIDENVKPTVSDEDNICYKVGDYVRATFDDGKDYEAQILEIDSSTAECKIKYVGYNNEEIVNVNDLIASWGRKARKNQHQDAAVTGRTDSDTEMRNGRNEEYGTSKNGMHFIEFPNLKNKKQIPPPPPPPMPPMLVELTEDSENLSAMLMSWYMSGYYTGVYQGQKMVGQKSLTINSNNVRRKRH